MSGLLSILRILCERKLASSSILNKPMATLWGCMGHALIGCTAELESDTAVHVDRDDDSDSNDEVA